MKKVRRIELYIERERVLVERRMGAAASALCAQCRRIVPALPLEAASVEAGIAAGQLDAWLATGTVHLVAPTATLLCAESLLRALTAPAGE